MKGVPCDSKKAAARVPGLASAAFFFVAPVIADVLVFPQYWLFQTAGFTVAFRVLTAFA